MASPVQQQGKGELDRIYNDPDTPLSLDLFERFKSQSLNEAGFKDYPDLKII